MSGWMDDAGSWDQAAVEAISFVDSLSAPPDHTDVSNIVFRSFIMGQVHRAIRLSFLVPEARRAVARVLAIHRALGHAPNVLICSVQKVARLYRQVFSIAFHDQLVKALGNADCSDLVSLGMLA